MTHEVTPTEAWEILSSDPSAVLVDVRTPQEWATIGLPDLSDLDKEVVLATWAPFFALAPAGYLEAIQRAGVEGRALMICRSGARSTQAAQILRRHGYEAINVAEGFEGTLGPSGRRQGGWKGAGLPHARPQA